MLCVHPHIHHSISLGRCGPELPPVPCSHVTTARLLAGLPKLARGETNKFDITFFAILLLDDPGMKYICSDTHMQIHVHVHAGNVMQCEPCCWTCEQACWRRKARRARQSRICANCATSLCTSCTSIPRLHSKCLTKSGKTSLTCLRRWRSLLVRVYSSFLTAKPRRS